MTPQAVFWGAAAAVFYVYAGYPLLLALLSRMKPARVPPAPSPPRQLPKISLIIAAYNEERVIARKLDNSLALDYPRDKLQIIVAADGCADATPAIARSYADRGVRLVELPDNVGKASAQNKAVESASGEILIFTDAEAFLREDALTSLAGRFGDERVGCAVGRVVYDYPHSAAVGEGEGAYWRYEVFLRRMESGIGNLLAGSGALIAVRRGVFEPVDPAVSEDFFLPMKAAMRGYRTEYEHGAVCRTPLSQIRPGDMFRTKLRTINLDTRGVFLCRGLLNPFKHPLYAWGLVSHKILRWLAPYFLVCAFVLSLGLAGHPAYGFMLSVQVLFYALALAGWAWPGGNPPLVFGSPFFFCLVNSAALAGTARFAFGKTVMKWSPVR